ncbi:siroheme decarboxylase subunit alpha [Dethiobacter alkaliphilus]|uniref:siroheme decarboxylase n=1 Tax=Dethiobacter alkaliphilus AHT 1 TaxID=555088 RepID=C0GG51_DETAL|nr:AsnC family transcriptional regulator [Dethiobacter alkaliphilus]EEG77740.1 transcriptional regulator, AsnC family [Dethiobacter alkaliphilus AHT 1]
MKQSAANLSGFDREILNILQSRYPLVSRPYAAIAQEVGLTEEEVMKRVATLKESGLVRRIGGIFDSQKMGFSSTLVALKVQEDKTDAVAQAVSAYPGVTHNYQRAHEFNVWFTLVTRSEEELQKTLNEIMDLDGVVKLRNLPALNLFKIGVNFDMSEA